MQKYIAVVNPKMDEDEITRLIQKGIAGALFEISHQNYPVAMKLIEMVKRLSRKYHKPISIIQDVSSMEDPLDLKVGLKSGVHWIATDKHEHLKMARGLDKLAGLIYKGRNLPKGIQVDSVMADNFLDPDAEVRGQSFGQIKHLITEHKNQHILDSIIHFADHSHAKSLAVSDLELAKALSHRRTKHKIIFAPANHDLAAKGSIYWGVHPVYAQDNLISALKHRELVQKGERVVDAMDSRHITIHLVP